MAQQQVNISLASPGFNGLDTVNSPITQDTSFAAVADNCVIDSYGRIGARKAFAEETTTFPTFPTIVGATTYKLVLHAICASTISGVESTIVVGQNIGYNGSGAEVGSTYHILERDGTSLVDLTLPVMSDDSKLVDATICPTEDRYFICVPDNETMEWDGTTVTLISADPAYIGIQNVNPGPEVPPEFIGAISTHGRIWGWGHLNDEETIYYSDLLIGASYFTAGGADPNSTAGKINVLKYWPNGLDRIVGLASHNNRLIVFGRSSILVFNMGYGDPADSSSGFALEDTISNVGLVSRHAITSIGTDLLFVDDTGVRSLARTIQERSSPLGDLTNRIRLELSEAIHDQADQSGIKLLYNHRENFVILRLDDFCYCLDMRSYAIEGFTKITRWTDTNFNNMAYLDLPGSEAMLLSGNDGQGLMKYDGLTTYGGVPYNVRYYTNPLTFGQAANSKFVKQVDFTIISSVAPATAFVRWGYDRLTATKSRALAVDADTPSYYNEGFEYNVATYGDSDVKLKRYKVNVGGKGESFTLGIEIEIDGNGFSLQEINIQTLVGRLN